MRSSYCLFAIAILVGERSASADIIINIFESAGGVEASWSGAGTAAASISDVSTLDFIFPGSPFGANSSNTMAPGLAVAFDGEFVPSVYDTISLTGGNTLQLSSAFGAATGSLTAGSSTYETNNLIGVANVISGLSFSDLTPGTYLATTGDAAAFGQVRLNIGAATVPEPSHLLVIPLLIWGIRRLDQKSLLGRKLA